MEKGYVLPWYCNVSIVFGVLILLVEKSSMDMPGFWADNWWPLLRLIGGFFAFLWFIDACTNGPTRRANDRYFKSQRNQ